MPGLPLTTTIGSYAHTRALKDGRVNSEKLDLQHIEISPIISVFRRMIRGLEFDVSEMSLSTYLCALAHNIPITAIPIFLARGFAPWVHILQCQFRHQFSRRPGRAAGWESVVTPSPPRVGPGNPADLLWCRPPARLLGC